MIPWQVPKMWTEDCWIIGGGASMPRQFDVPEEIITKVGKGEQPLSTFSSYLTPLHAKNVIGVNMAFMLGDWVSMMYFCDAKVFRLYKESLLAFRNLKVTCVSHLHGTREETMNIKRLKRDYKPGLSLKPDTICWNMNSGTAAINFAILAGARRILLLGFDMKEENGRTHWHGVYGTKTPRPSFKRFLNRYPEVAKQAKKLGVEILNVSPDSALDVFPKVSLKEIL